MVVKCQTWLMHQHLKSAIFSLVLGALGLAAAQPLQAATLIYAEDFEGSSTDLSSWSLDTGSLSVDTTPSGRGFLGREDSSNFGLNNDTVTLSLSNPLLEDSQINLSFDLFVIGTWNGIGVSPTGVPFADLFRVQVNGNPLLERGFANPSPAADVSEINALGYNHGGDIDDTVYALELSFISPGDSLQLEFLSLLSEPLIGESWGIDNVLVTASRPLPPAAVPEPVSLLAISSIFGLRLLLQKKSSL